ncbi:alpha/beta fold hydrolase [Amycolatopsis sp. NPDC004625]|uniref:alpha/beta fold hydrolase n=1 Tax=Amycolatopsis sp. NPDC004625 TaxID=3154670 RepID=UPI0033ADAB53
MNALPVTRTPSSGAPVGPPVVLLHGFASSGAADWPAPRWAGPLAEAGRETFVVHLPGHRDGPAVAAVEDVTTGVVLRRLAAAVPAGELDVVGYSLGARLAWSLAADEVLPVRRLVLGGLSGMDPFAALDPAALRAAVRTGAAEDPLTAGIAGLVRAGDAESLLRLVEGLGREPFDPAGAVPKVPTLFLAGAADPMAAGVEKMAGRLPDARLQHVPGDHQGALAADELRTAVFGFLLN